MLVAIALAGDVPVVISGPEVPYDGQRAIFREKFAGLRVHPEYSRVELLHSRRGVLKHQNFITPAEAKTREKALAAQTKAAKNTVTPPSKDPDLSETDSP